MIGGHTRSPTPFTWPSTVVLRSRMRGDASLTGIPRLVTNGLLGCFWSRWTLQPSYGRNTDRKLLTSLLVLQSRLASRCRFTTFTGRSRPCGHQGSERDWDPATVCVFEPSFFGKPNRVAKGLTQCAPTRGMFFWTISARVRACTERAPRERKDARTQGRKLCLNS